MQEVKPIHVTEQARGAIETTPGSRIQTLLVTVTEKNDPCIDDSGQYRFALSSGTFIFEDSPTNACCQLVCHLVKPDGSPFPAQSLNFQGCRPQGAFFDKHVPSWHGEGTNTLRIDFDFSSGNAAGALELDLSNGQSIQGIDVFNASKVLRHSNDVQTITFTRTKDGHYSHSPSTGIRFNNTSKEAPSILLCMLTGPDGLPSDDDVFIGYEYDTFDKSTVLAPRFPKDGTTAFALWFLFDGVAAGGALKVHINHCGVSIPADPNVVDPQVVNVPTTGCAHD